MMGSINSSTAADFMPEFCVERVRLAASRIGFCVNSTQLGPGVYMFQNVCGQVSFC